VVVAVPLVGVMQVPCHQVVDMVSVWNGFMTASRTMDMRRLVRSAGMLGRADPGIARAHLDGVLVDVVAVHAVQVPVVQVIHMVAMKNGLVAAAGPVYMSVGFVDRMFVVHRRYSTSLPDRRLWRKRRAEERSGRSLRPPEIRYQNDAFSPSCQLRASPAVAVILPKALLVGEVLGVEKFVWLNAL